jgi:hypothetical protein
MFGCAVSFLNQNVRRDKVELIGFAKLFIRTTRERRGPKLCVGFNPVPLVGML